MKAARLRATRAWEFVHVDEPVPGAGQMRVCLEQVAVCGSDLPEFLGVHPGFPKAAGGTGHEGIGRVESCPSGSYAEGERVLLWGFDRGHGLFQEAVLTLDQGLLRLPSEEVAERMLLTQLLGTVIRPFRKLGNVINQSAVVLGQGPAGLLFTAVLRNLGARDIVAVEPLSWRRELASRMGAPHTLDPGAADPAKAIAGITGGAMADLVVEAGGDAETYGAAALLCRRGGAVIGFGVPDKQVAGGVLDLPLLEMQRREINLVMTLNAGDQPYDDYANALTWIEEGRLDLSGLVSHVLPFAEIQRAFELAADKPAQDRPAKIVLSFEAPR